MKNDAKLGLLLGVGVVVAVGVLFFHRDLASGKSAAVPKNQQARAASAAVTANSEDTEVGAGGRAHTVAEGDTLFSLAKRYYGDGDRFADIYRANRRVLRTPDELPAGTVLVIPELAP